MCVLKDRCHSVSLNHVLGQHHGLGCPWAISIVLRVLSAYVWFVCVFALLFEVRFVYLESWNDQGSISPVGCKWDRPQSPWRQDYQWQDDCHASFPLMSLPIVFRLSCFVMFSVISEVFHTRLFVWNTSEVTRGAGVGGGGLYKVLLGRQESCLQT